MRSLHKQHFQRFSIEKKRYLHTSITKILFLLLLLWTLRFLQVFQPYLAIAMKCHNFHHFRQYLTYFGQHSSSSSRVFFILFLYTPLLLLLLNSLIALFWRTFLNLPMNKQVKVVCHKDNYLHKMPTPKLPPQNGTRSVSPQRSKKQSLLADFSCHFQMLPEMLANSWGP